MDEEVKKEQENACQAEGGGFMVWFTIPAR